MDSKIRFTVRDPETRNAVTTEYNDCSEVLQETKKQLNQEKVKGVKDGDNSVSA